jgi:RNA polymerase sigma factor (sigma-70 family)
MSRSVSDGDPSWDSTILVLSRAQDGDRSAVRILIERAVPPLRRWTHGRIPPYGRGAVNTEDLVQDAVLHTLKRIRTFEHRTVDALQKYLRRSVVNGIRDVIRRVKRRGIPIELPEAVPDSALSPEELAIINETSEMFVRALQRLRPTDRQIMICRVELGYSFEQIADCLGKSVDATRMAVSRAMKRTQQEIAIEIAASSRRSTCH